MNIGKLNLRIKFQTLDTESDWGENYKTVCSTWAREIRASAKDIISGKAEVNLKTRCFEMRYRSDVNPDMVILFDDNVHEIKSIIDVGSRKIKMHVICEVIDNVIS